MARDQLHKGEDFVKKLVNRYENQMNRIQGPLSRDVLWNDSLFYEIYDKFIKQNGDDWMKIRRMLKYMKHQEDLETIRNAMDRFSERLRRTYSDMRQISANLGKRP